MEGWHCLISVPLPFLVVTHFSRDITQSFAGTKYTGISRGRAGQYHKRFLVPKPWFPAVETCKQSHGAG